MGSIVAYDLSGKSSLVNFNWLDKTLIVAFSLVLLRSYHLGIFGICVCRLREVVFLSMNGEVNVCSLPGAAGQVQGKKNAAGGTFHVLMHCK